MFRPRRSSSVTVRGRNVLHYHPFKLLRDCSISALTSFECSSNEPLPDYCFSCHHFSQAVRSATAAFTATPACEHSLRVCTDPCSHQVEVLLFSIRTYYVKCVLCMHSPVRSWVESDFSISCLVLLTSSLSVVSDQAFHVGEYKW